LNTTRINRKVFLQRSYGQGQRRVGCGRWLWVAVGFFGTGIFCCALAFIIPLIVPAGVVNILIIGVDARPDEEIEYARTDSILLVGVQPNRMRVSLLSIPRDLYIDMPGYGLQRVNTIHRTAGLDDFGTGPQALKDSIGLSFGVQPGRYVRLGFDAFVALVDAVGGVEVDVPRTIVDDAYPTSDGGTTTVRFNPGLQWMDGTTALIYARTRHADDDYQRAARQQQVLGAVAGKLANPIYWLPASASILRNVDTDLSPFDLWRAAPSLLVNGFRPEHLVIDREYIVSVAGGAAPNYDKLRPWISERFE
jgi:LCP family protein required for cell wall assembly